MLEPGRNYSVANTNYRYGFNGKENDNDIENGMQDYGMRIYDGRLGRFLSVDPITKKFPMLTPYQFASNRPIQGVDFDGKEVLLVPGNVNFFGLLAGYNLGGGFGIGPDGVAIYAGETIQGGLGAEMGASLNGTVFTKMKHLSDLQGGVAWGGSLGGGWGGKVGMSIQNSGGYWGASFGGGPGVGLHISGDAGFTIYLKVIKWNDIATFFQQGSNEAKQLMEIVGIDKNNIQNAITIVKNYYDKKTKEIIQNRINLINEKNIKNQARIQESDEFIKDYKKSNLIYQIGAYINKKEAENDKKEAENDIQKNNQELKTLQKPEQK